MSKLLSFEEMEKISRLARKSVIEMIYSAGSGHPGGSLSIIDILVVLYFGVMKIDPNNPQWEDRDRLVLSKGHGAAGYYAVLSEKGFFPKKDLTIFDSINGNLQGHPCMNKTPGVDMSTGSLGQGLSVACGMAYGAKLKKKDIKIYSILGDGEIQEGQIWEAAMFAGNYKLNNLTAIIDYNKLQITGTVDEVMSIEPIGDKFKAFGWQIINVDGHSYPQLLDVLNKNHNYPLVVIAHTIKGKGVSFMENQMIWHSAIIKKQDYLQALQELDGRD